MSNPILAIASCRVSSDEQLKNNSLNRQRDSVIAAAERLGVAIAENGWWSGSVSSKHGNNLNRKDIHEMLDFCDKNKNVKYLIVDEPDRFMRSSDEAIYITMQFKLKGVKVWYASVILEMITSNTMTNNSQLSADALAKNSVLEILYNSKLPQQTFQSV